MIKCIQYANDIEDHIKFYEGNEAYEKIHKLITQSKNLTQIEFADLLYQYGNLIYFGQNPQNNSLKLALYYFKLSAMHGSPKALFMTSLFSNFRLDGSFNILQNIDRLLEEKQKNNNESQSNNSTDLKFDDLTEVNLMSIFQYISEKRNSSSVLDLYLSSQQQNFYSQLALAHKYMHGRGVKLDCRTASLYFKDLGSVQYLDQEIIPNHGKIIRLDLQIYSMSKDIFSYYLNYDKIKILENFKQLSLNFKKTDLQDLFYLAQSYFYGINGVKRDFHKSFELYMSIYDDQNQKNEYSVKAGSMIGYQYMKGFGVKQDYSIARQYFLKVVEHQQTIALNGLGYIYYNGLGVPQDQRKGISYFKQSALLKDSNGIYNYGVIHMLPTTDKHLRDKQIAHQYLNVAAEKGHSLAQYALGLIYLDGVDFYQSCELSTLLMSRSLTKSISSHFQNQANYLYSNNDYRQSHLNFLISGYLGEDTSLLNAAIIVDKHYKIYSKNDIDFSRLQEELDNDIIYNELKKQNLIKADMYDILFEDISQLVRNRTTLNKLLSLDNNQSHNTINEYVSYILLKTSAGWSGYSNLKLGDYFYYGINVHQNYEKAYQHYKLAAERKDQSGHDEQTYIQAQGYFNLAYMEQLGQGVDKNYKLAYQHFNQSLSIVSNNVLANMLLRINFLEDLLKVHERETQVKILMAIFEFTKSTYNEYRSLIKILSCVPFIIAILYLYGKRLRIKNANNL